MKTLLIILNLGPLSSILLNQNIIPYLKETGTWARLSDNLWLIKTPQTTTRIRDDLRNLLATSLSPSAERVIVLDVTKADWASYNISSEVTNWIRDNI